MNLEKEIEQIKARNIKVEADKAWETSWTRVGALSLVTYVSMTLLLFNINNESPFINALVPTFGYFLSSLSIPFIKKFWLKNLR